MIRLNDDEIFELSCKAGMGGNQASIDFANAIQDALAEKNKGEPIGQIILGGLIETSQGVEFGGCEAEISQAKIEELQEALVSTTETLYLPVFLAPQPDCEKSEKAKTIFGPIGVFRGVRNTPEGTREFWGELTEDAILKELFNGTILYTTPQPDRVAELEAEVKRLKEALELAVSEMKIYRTEAQWQGYRANALNKIEAALAASKGAS